MPIALHCATHFRVNGCHAAPRTAQNLIHSFSLHLKSSDKQDRKEGFSTKREEMRTESLMQRLEARLYGSRSAPPPRCPCCGMPLCDGERQYFARDGSAVGCESCITVRWH